MKHILKLVFIFLPFINGGDLFAQLQGQVKIDSLLKELPRQKEDTNKVRVLDALASIYYSVDPDECIKFSQQELDLASKLNKKKAIAAANMNLGLGYFKKGDYSKAMDFYLKTLQIGEELKNKNIISKATGNIGLVYDNQGNSPKALEFLGKALKMAEEAGDKGAISRQFANLGSVYNMEGDYPKALEYELKALKISEELKDNYLIATISGTIGNIYKKQGDFSKALEYDLKALKIHEEIGNKFGMATNIGNIGNIYDAQGDDTKALEYDMKALKISEELKDKNGIALQTCNIGNLYMQQKNYTMAVEYAQRSLKVADEVGYKELSAANLCIMAEVYIAIVKDTAAKTNRVAGDKEFLRSGFRLNVSIPSRRADLLNSAIDYIHRGKAMFLEMNSLKSMQECYEDLSEIYKLKGDYKKAMEYGDSSRAIKDSIFSQDNKEAFVKLEMKDQYGRQRLTDSLKTAEKEKIGTIQLQRQKTYTYIGIAGILLLAGFSFFIVKERGKSENERKKSDDLLLNILPAEVAVELKAKGTTTAKHYDNVTVLFTDFVNFTKTSEQMKPQVLIDELHACFKAFDEITAKYGIEKIKTIGDAYLAVAGLPSADPKHAENVVRATIEINAFMNDRLAKLGNRTFEVRMGIHTGSVVAGIVGVKKFAYDIWGDTVNTAARMEQHGEPGKINISQTTYELVKGKFNCEYRGEIEAKGKGVMKMYFVG